ncbi:Bacillibactin transport regulator [Pragia fontium]|uniref:4-hydroxyphenylacetate catabolism regulatory protein HpaA n=1 Tax=Pragia fontium TaxID=82985 RepID=UPI00064AB838|nr:4-hydroxyphenylacetate catabolism regulatory protein HpaA [Pragia fontium]AKJ43126.1 4-hydroxyphenylacetate catabolism regulator HpaA [Pragia fontium]SUB83574.1 Bacillibactin transport regulator [Pragia fontium]
MHDRQHHSSSFIPNIDISKVYDARYESRDVHYESFARLAEFFGRDMQVHWHDCYFQIHFLDSGQIELQLDDQHYSVHAPLFIITPPSIPHAFNTKSDSDGHVLTLRQELVWPLLEKCYPGNQGALNLPAICQSLSGHEAELTTIRTYWQMIASEFQSKNTLHQETLTLLSQALFIQLLRNIEELESSVCSVKGNIKLFQRFNLLISQHYREHYTVPNYAEMIGITESRLNDLCRRFSNLPPKRLIFERLVSEAKRRLLFSSDSIHIIAYQLGFKDPAYFARFFSRMTGSSPTNYRLAQAQLINAAAKPCR